jgi:hypothetical protein
MNEMWKRREMPTTFKSANLKGNIGYGKRLKRILKKWSVKLRLVSIGSR